MFITCTTENQDHRYCCLRERSERPFVCGVNVGGLLCGTSIESIESKESIKSKESIESVESSDSIESIESTVYRAYRIYRILRTRNLQIL